jgi:sugar/nucleoside kinase (ribokinase family)
MRSGGSAANTVIGVAQSGGTGFYTGKVSRDVNGEFYRQDMLESGVHFDVHPAPETGSPTGTCLVLTTPDAERTMCTHLGVSSELSVADIDVDRLVRCKYSYLEGYLWDSSETRAACYEVMEQSRRHGVKVSLTFSDPWLVRRYAGDFRQIVRDQVDVVFCNAEEICHFYETESLDDACDRLAPVAQLAFVTDGPNGCRVLHQGREATVEGFEVKAIDTVGAGDAFAGGVLFGLTHGYSPIQAARWGNYLASRVVMIQGARLHGSVSDRVWRILHE